MTQSYYISMLIVSLIAVGFAIYSKKRFHESNLAIPFFWCMVNLAAWSMTYYLEFAVSDPVYKFLMVRLRPLFVFGILNTGIILSLRYSGWTHLLNFKTVVPFCVVQIGFIITILTERYHNFFLYDFRAITTEGVSRVIYERGPLYASYIAFDELMTIVYMTILGGLAYKARKQNRLPIIVIMFAPSVPPLIDVLYGYGVSPMPGINTSGYFWIIGEVSLFIALFQLNFPRQLVHIGRSEAIDSMMDVMLILDSQNRIVDFNPVARERFGLTRAILGHSISNVLGKWAVFSECFVVNYEVKEKLVIDSGVGKGVYILSISLIKNHAHQVIGKITVFHDITEEEKAKKALEERTYELDKANQAKNEFLANMSHEVRTPLTGIIGLTELLSVTSLNSEQKKYVKGIHGSSEALLGIINDVLDISKIESGRVTFENKLFNMREVIRQSLWLISKTAIDKGIVLRSEYDKDSPDFFIGDSIRLRQIIINLLSNAVKFTNSGHIILRVRYGVRDAEFTAETQSPQRNNSVGTSPCHTNSELRNVNYGGKNTESVACKRELAIMPTANYPLPPEKDQNSKDRTQNASLLTIEVEDTGAGIKENELDLIFEKFYQSKIGKNIKTGGTGLGLTLTKQLVEMMDGHISVRSKFGEGTTFIVELPLIPATEPEIIHCENAVESREEDKTLLKPNIKVLLVEDTEINLTTIKEMLEKIGCSVDIARNGNDAVTLAENIDYDIIFMDCIMPELNGIEATKQIRMAEYGTRKRKPIVALSASITTNERNLCYESGMDDFLPKPFSMAQLREKILKFCSLTSIEKTQISKFKTQNSESRAQNPEPRAQNSEVQSPKSKVQTQNLGHKLPVFDKEALLSLVGGNREFLKKLLSNYLREIPYVFQELSDAVNAETMEDAARAAHTLKGMFGQLCANRAQQIACESEHTTRNGDIENTQKLLGKIKSAWDELQSVIVESSL